MQRAADADDRSPSSMAPRIIREWLMNHRYFVPGDGRATHGRRGRSPRDEYCYGNAFQPPLIRVTAAPMLQTAPTNIAIAPHSRNTQYLFVVLM